MDLVRIRTTDGTPLDAMVEVGDGEIVLHSRSGAGANARNQDYRKALETILMRLADRRIELNVYLDSRPVQHLPLNQRRIASGSQLKGPIAEQFDFLVRAMNAGSNSRRAWRRVLLKTSPIPASDLLELLGHAMTYSSVRRVGRLPNSEQRQVTAQHVHSAVDRLLAGDDAPNFADSRDYDLLTRTGERLAPKKVFGLALEEALNIEALPGHFSAGWGQPCFEILQEAGYRIIEKTSSTTATKAEIQTAHKVLPPNSEELRWAEGDIRIVAHLQRERTRNSKAADAKRAAIRHSNYGRLVCEHCHTDWYAIYPPEIAECVFDIHHTIPLADMREDHETVLEDLLWLCSNCHRAEHRRMLLRSRD